MDKRQHAALTQLSRLAQRRPKSSGWLADALHGRLDALVEMAVDVATETGDPLSEALMEEVRGESLKIVLRLLHRCETEERIHSVSLRELALLATERYLTFLLNHSSQAEEPFQAETARMTNNFGLRLWDLGRREEALDAIQGAAAVWAWLSRQRPESYLHHCATCLANLALLLSENGQLDEAVQTAQEVGSPPATRFRTARSVSPAAPCAFLPHLARSLHNLADTLRQSGRRAEAVEASREFVETLRSLAASRPEAFLPDLARGLDQLGACLGENGEPSDARRAADEAIALYRKLAEVRPEVFSHD